jgi:prophage DNA circulation protein
MVLRLIQHGQTADFHRFAEKSMIQHELHRKQTGQTHLIDQLASTLLRKKTAIEFLRTPIDACRAYIGFSAQLKTAVNRKRKDCERELRVLKETHRAIEEDAKQVVELDRIQTELETERTHANNLESYLVSQTGHICDILKTHGFVSYNEEAGYAFTPLGQVAANIAEGANAAGPRDFARYLQMAIASASETESHLDLALRTAVMPAETVMPFIDEVIEVRKMLIVLRRRVLEGG